MCLCFLSNSVDGTELFQKIIERGSFSEMDAVKIIRQVVDGIAYVHEHGMAHRDLKPENLLCATGDDGEILIKIADFGLSKAFSDGDPLKTACGTPDYAAPEVLTFDQTGYSDAVDLWSIGVITYVLLCGYPPFYADTVPELFEAIKRGTFSFPSAEWSTISANAKDFISKLIVVDPKARLTAQQARAHPWLADDSAATGAINFSRFQQYATQRQQQAA